MATAIRLLLTATLLACGASKQEPPANPAGDGATTVEAKPAPADAGQPAKPEETREQRVARALARVGDIQKEVAKLRGLSFEKPVPAKYQTAEEFRAFLKREIDREVGPEKNKALSLALYRIGFLAEKIDLAKVIEDAMASQAGAYYDPRTRAFYMVMVPKADLILDTLSSHELTHALQHEHFDLLRYYGETGPDKGKLSEDQKNARRFIVEGEASLIMTIFTPYQMTKMNLLEEKYAPVLRQQLKQMGSLSTEQLVAQTKSMGGAFADIGEEMVAALEGIDKIPPYIITPLLQSYTAGVLPVFEAYAHGGWKGVADLYEANPPDSTEQVLHPETKLFPKRDYPVTLTLPRRFRSLKGWSEIHSEVLGELTWRVYLELWEVEEANAATAGWDGDRVAVFSKEDKAVGLVATTWDSTEDAQEFAAAYLKSLRKRFPQATQSKVNGLDRANRPDGTVVALRLRGRDVYIVDGAAPEIANKLMKELMRTKARKHKKDR